MSAFDDWAKTVPSDINLNDWDRRVFNAGMTRAAEIATKVAEEQREEGNDSYGVGGQISEAILAARAGS